MGNENWGQGVGGVVIRNDTVLLARHTYGAAAGKLLIPGGYVNIEETPEAAIVREIMEETSVLTKVSGLIGIRYNLKNWYSIFLMEYIDGTPASDKKENSEVYFKNIEEAICDKDMTSLTKTILISVAGNRDKILKKTEYDSGLTAQDFSLYI